MNIRINLFFMGSLFLCLSGIIAGCQCDHCCKSHQTQEGPTGLDAKTQSPTNLITKTQESKTQDQTVSIPDITEEKFSSDVIEASKNKLILVDFYTEWCRYCKMIHDELKKLTQDKEFKDLCTIVQINAEHAQELAGKYGIVGYPTLLLFGDEKLAGTLEGYAPQGKIKEFVLKHVNHK
jgi:putative thioredoxin